MKHTKILSLLLSILLILSILFGCGINEVIPESNTQTGTVQTLVNIVVKVANSPVNTNVCGVIILKMLITVV